MTVDLPLLLLLYVLTNLGTLLLDSQKRIYNRMEFSIKKKQSLAFSGIYTIVQQVKKNHLEIHEIFVYIF